MRATWQTTALALPLVLLLSGSPAGQTRPPGPAGATATLIDVLDWRHIGPAAFGGRIDDVEAVPDRPWIIFVGAASGGIFKSVNQGVTWKPVFDEEGGTLSIGDLAIAPSDPNIVWAGTGEPNNRQSSSWGDGVYKSVDGGETWVHMGLADTHHIGRIVIDPRHADIVFVAALGHLWGPNDERGLYKTTDGGRTWRRVLGIDADTGVVDVAMDADGRTLFAAAYQRRRRAWGFVGGGPGSALYRSLDAGETWTKLEKGLPAGPLGRIGVAIAPSAPAVVYAVVEHKTEGGVYRSDDRGETWTKQSSVNPRPMYYSQIRVDPANPDRVWLLGTNLHLSRDGGRSFTTEGTGEKIHVDHHALWIDPRNGDRLMLGNDGGLYFSYDGSRTWHFCDNLPIGQYYDIGIDRRDPYWIYGGTQDNGTWALPSRTHSALGITNADVVNVAYGDGFYTEPDHSDGSSRLVYANSQSGRTYLVDLETREEKGIRPVPADPNEKYRFNWSTPLLVSPHDPKTVYYGGNKLFRTTDRGHTWTEVSPDLTKNQDWKKLPIMGGQRNEDTLSRDDGVSDYNTLTTIDASPVQQGVIYTGADDGSLHVTRDGGRTWRNVTERVGLPGPRWVSRVLASRHAAGTAYATFDGHQDDDFAPYVFRTTDFGETWRAIRGDLPDGVVANTIAEHPRNPDLLFLGTETGLFYTIDGGRRWTPVRGTLPRVPIDDVVVAERDNDLVLGTHGRSIVILDDLAPLEHLSDRVLSSDAFLFPVRPATQTYYARMLPVPGASEFAGPNPPRGALITYYLKDDPPAKAAVTEPAARGQADGSRGGGAPPASSKEGAPAVAITILDAGGAVVRELAAPDRKGLHRVVWDLRRPLRFEPLESDEGWFGPPAGPFVLPGTYTVKLSARGRELTQTIVVRADPRVPATLEALVARHDTAESVNELLRAFSDAQAALKRLDAEQARMKEALEAHRAAAGAAGQAVDGFAKALGELKEKFRPGWGGPRFALLDLLGQLQASTGAPTEAQLRAHDHLKQELVANIGALNDLVTKTLPAAQAALAGAGVASPALKPVAPPK